MHDNQYMESLDALYNIIGDGKIEKKNWKEGD